MRDPDLLDFVFALGHIELWATCSANDVRFSERDSGEILAAARRQLPNLGYLRDDLSIIIDAAEKAIGPYLESAFCFHPRVHVHG